MCRMIPIEFPSSGSILKAYFFPSFTQPALGTLVFLQGFPGFEGDELICSRLAQANLHVLTFNYRGTFGSEGNFSFMNAVADGGAALQFLQRTSDIGGYAVWPEGILLGGWSFGGGIVPLVTSQNPEVTRFFMISGRNFGAEAHKIAQDAEYAAQVVSNLQGLRPPHGPLTFQDDVLSGLIEHGSALDHLDLAPRLKDRRILLIGGWDDEVVPVEDHTLPFYRALVESGAENVQIEVLPDTHEFSHSKDHIVRILLEWMQQ